MLTVSCTKSAYCAVAACTAAPSGVGAGGLGPKGGHQAQQRVFLKPTVMQYDCSTCSVDTTVCCNMGGTTFLIIIGHT